MLASAARSAGPVLRKTSTSEIVPQRLSAPAHSLHPPATIESGLRSGVRSTATRPTHQDGAAGAGRGDDAPTRHPYATHPP